MKLNPFNLSLNLSKLAACACAAGWLAGQAVIGQTIPNPSFETDTFTVSPGYISGNTAITGWTGTPADRVGLNPSDGSPFANNGTIPDGNNVAFIQCNVTDPGTPSTLSTTISGLTPGNVYKVTFRANARSEATANTPNVKVLIDGTPVLLPGGWVDGLSTRAVTGTLPYFYIAFEFTAAAASQTLAIVNDVAEGDHTLLVDDFRIAPASGRWAVEAWTSDFDSGLDSTYFYTHAYNFGTAANATINNIPFTGIGGTAPNVPGKFSTTFFGSLYGDNDPNVFDSTGEGSETLANNFVYGGNVPAGSFQSISLTDLTPNTDHVFTIYSVGWEDPRLDARWVTFSFGDDYLTINQDQFFNNYGIRISYRYTSDENGNATIRISPLIQNTTFHAYGFSNREAESRLAISGHPRGAIVSPGVSQTFTVTAAGLPVLEYQWRLNGNEINGATEASYIIPSVSAADAGSYDVIVSNSSGSITSQVAQLTVGAIAVANASFEADAFIFFPGYVSGNAPITGWTALGGHGLNPLQDGTGASPFANNGAIPHGAQVAFMQDNGALSQILSGFTVGGQYYVHYYENARGGNSPAVEVQVGGNTVLPARVVTSVGGGNPYREISSAMFTASATDLELSFIKSNPLGGDNTALIDNVAIIQVAAGTLPTISQQPQSATVYTGQSASFSVVAQGSLPLVYQWRLDGQPLTGATASTLSIAEVGLADEGDYTLVITNSSGSVTSAVARLSLLESIPSLRNTGIDAGGNAQPGGAVSPFWTLPINADTNSTDAFVGNEGFPIGTWLNNSAVSKWIGPRAALGEAIAAGDYVYRTTFDLANRDTNTVVIVGRWSTDNSGTGVYLNGTQLSVPLSTSFTAWTSFTLSTNNATFLPGINTLEFAVNNAEPPGPTGLRVEFTQASARTLPGVPATVASSPQGAKIAEGDSITLNVSANGTLPISYQWRKNGVDIQNQTGQSLTLSNVTTNDTGNYSARVSNAWGSEISASAFVNVGYRPIPGIFGTGLDASGQLLADGAVDPHYIMSVSADAFYPGPDAIVVNNAWPIAPAGPWLANGPDSRWIAPQANQNQSADPNGVNAQGSYTFQTTFSLAGYDLSKVSVVGSVAVDNTLSDILVNGVSTGTTSPGFTAYTPFTITTGLVAGNNTLDFLMANAGEAPSPVGLRVNLKALLDIGAAEPTVTLSVGITGNTVSISWAPAVAGQTLQWAPSVTGPWTDITGAANPYTASASEPQRYYRIVE
ncbi:MAG: immunoglobulin domain-containing protein [Verrucomicrobia bacterium]|nr:immunoglobulin domain-containing protein [Verrucomicrobiota bacterium]